MSAFVARALSVIQPRYARCPLTSTIRGSVLSVFSVARTDLAGLPFSAFSALSVVNAFRVFRREQSSLPAIS